MELELRDVMLYRSAQGRGRYAMVRSGAPVMTVAFHSGHDSIAADHQTADNYKRVMLRKWLQSMQSDPEASWERLAAALTLMGHIENHPLLLLETNFRLLPLRKTNLLPQRMKNS